MDECDKTTERLRSRKLIRAQTHTANELVHELGHGCRKLVECFMANIEISSDILECYEKRS